MKLLSALNARERRLAGAALLLSALVACADVLFTAPPGSSISLNANPLFVAANGGVSVITALAIEPNGTPVSDGTIILFFTDLGTIEPQGKTKNGLAKVNFISDSRSGVAHVRAFSGGPAPAGGGTTTPSPNPSASTAPPPTGGGGGSGEDTVEIQVGNIRIQDIRLRADPPRITNSNSTHVFALVIDANGNGIPNVPVTFEVLSDNGSASPAPSGGNGTEFFDVSGPVFTNNNGEAENVLRTRRETQGTARVQAVAPGPSGFVVSSTALSIPIL